MAGDAKSELRRVLLRTIEAFIVSAERGGAQGLGNALAVFQVSPQFAALLDGGFETLFGEIQKEQIKQKRNDTFQRLLAHPLTDAFSSGRLSRDYLPNFFSFVHLVLGDQMAELAARAESIADKIREEERHSFDWDMFYDDPGANEVLWMVLARIADTFRRFDARKEWFLGLMEYKPQAVSVASNVFIPKTPVESETPPPPFGAEEFNAMFSCLFGPLRALSSEQQRRFETVVGKPAKTVFAPLWENLRAGGATL